jgi:hypothetical protein
VSSILKQSASGSEWNPQLGWGRLDVAAAVELATRTAPSQRRAILNSRGR